MNTVTLITLIAETPESSPGSDYSEYKKPSSGQSSIESPRSTPEGNDYSDKSARDTSGSRASCIESRSPPSEIKGSPIKGNPIIILITLITRHTVTLITLIAETPDVGESSPGSAYSESDTRKSCRIQKIEHVS